MKFYYIAALAATTASAVANPHAHAHLHRHVQGLAKREPRPDKLAYAPAAVETVIKYVLDGHIIPEEEVRQGLANGTLMWGDDGNLSTFTNGPVALPTPAPAPAPAPAAAPAPKQDEKPQPAQDKPKSYVEPTKPSSQPSSLDSGSAPAIDKSLKTASQLVDNNGYCKTCDIEFPNNKISCTEFPYGYGAMPVSQEGLGGWSGIQDPGYRGSDGFDYIRTVVSGSCKDGTCCTPGTWCSYGCPNPYLKLSFPKTQGRTGQTVGGLFCNKDGKLEMADGSIGKTLCGQGSKSMSVKVVNRLSKSVSICRTDYPVGPGESGYLANPDQSKYFFWKNQCTSAHYYINKQGVSEADGCTWSSPNEARGNWAPTIFGTSWDDINMHQGFSSLKQNELNKNAQLDYSITFTGDGVVSPCKYKKSTNQYCQGDECWYDRDKGCTAATRQGGNLILVLSDD